MFYVRINSVLRTNIRSRKSKKNNKDEFIFEHLLQLNTNIKLIRELSGQTQEEFAELIKTNVSNLKTYERTATRPKAPVLHRISKIARISMDDLEHKKLTPSDIDFKGEKDEIDEKAQNGVKQDYLSGKNLENFSEAHNELVKFIVRGQPGTHSDQVLAPKILDLVTEIFSGKKQISPDELKKELIKALGRHNGYT